MKSNEDEALITGLPEDARVRLNRIADQDQRSILLDCLRRGEAIPDFAWEPISDFQSKLKAVESSDYRPATYWTDQRQPILGSRPNVRMPYFDVGEYLPELLPGETEIARIVLRSTTGDLVSIRVRRIENLIEYRVLDEYETAFSFDPQVSQKPLSLEEIVKMIDELKDESGSEFVWGVLDMNFPDGQGEDVSDFLSVHSSFYPGLHLAFARLLKERIRKP